MSGLRKRPLRRVVARVVSLLCALTLTATAGFGQTSFVPPNPPGDYKPLELEACTKPSQFVSLDLGTMSTNGPVNLDDPDPHWMVTGPSIPNPISPYYATLSAWTAPPTTWVEPIKSLNGMASSVAPSGDYVYTIWFRLNCPPESYSNLNVTGTFAADNIATVYLNAFPITNCVGGGCFHSATAFTASAPFVQGINSLSVIVRNDGAYTGMAVKAQLSGSCVSSQCVDASVSGLLKVCKVAGLGVPIGTPFIFTANGIPFAVPAGPAPGGTCVVGPRFLSGTQVNVQEAGPPGYSVSNITVVPQVMMTPHLGVNGHVTVPIGNGVTEVTFTDKAYAFVDKTGFLEICKAGPDTGNFTFMVAPAALAPTTLGPFVVPAGSCSGAIEVPAGPVNIMETPTTGLIMLGCSTIPAAKQSTCDPATQTSTVLVSPGNASTIAYISNGGIRGTGNTLSNPSSKPNNPATGKEAR